MIVFDAEWDGSGQQKDRHPEEIDHNDPSRKNESIRFGGSGLCISSTLGVSHVLGISSSGSKDAEKYPDKAFWRHVWGYIKVKKQRTYTP